MKVVKYPEPFMAEIVESKTPVINPDQALAKSLASNVSAGTELAFYKGIAPQLNYKANQQGLWQSQKNNITYPMQSDDPGCWWMGYGCVAEIIEVGSEVKDLKVGDKVFTHQTHKDYQVIGGDYYKLPPEITPEHGAFTMLVEICFTGTLDARINLMDNVVIFGMGTVGLLLLQMCKLSGAQVIAVDYIDERLKLAEKLGASKVINPQTDGDIAVTVCEYLGSKADKVIEASGNVNALNDAVRCCRLDGEVTVLSFYTQPPASLNLGREFHHNRVKIRSSQIGGIDPVLSNQYDWTSRGKTAVKLLEKLDIESLISCRTSFEDYPEILADLTENPSKYQSVIIKY